jgi:hypothetical protein
MKLALLITFLLAFQMSFAQLYVGTMQGVAISKVYFSPSYSQTLTTAYSGGVLLTYLENGGMGIDFGLLLTQRGWALNYEDTSYARLNNVLELPFLSHITLGKGNVRGILLIGANLGYIMSAKEESEVGSGSYSFTDADNRVTFGLSGGLGMKYVQPNWFTQITVRYVNDISNLYESPELTYSLNQFFLIQGGVSFRLKREN